MELILHSTEKYILVTNPKIATQFILRHYTKNHSKDELSQYDLEFTDNKWMINTIDSPHYTSTVDSNEYIDFSKFLSQNTSLEKDIIFLIRNPWERFKSAFIQDYIKKYFWVNESIKQELKIIEIDVKNNPIKYEAKPNINQRFDEFINHDFGIQTHSHHIKDTDTDEFLKEYSDVIEHIIQFKLYEIIDTHKIIYTTHNQPYLSMICFLILYYQNNKRIKIVDIGAQNLSEVLNRYDMKSEIYPPYHTAYFLSNLIHKVLEKPNMKKTLEYINQVLRIEREAHLILSSKQEIN